MTAMMMMVVSGCGSLHAVVQWVLKKIEGAYALVFLKNCTKGQLISKANFEVFI